MQISIQSRSFTLTDAIRDHVHKRINYTLTRTAAHIRRIEVRLSDINGSRGGIDKRCLIDIRISGTPNVVVEDVQADLYIAIDRAVSRAARTLMRRMALKAGKRRPDPALLQHRSLAQL